MREIKKLFYIFAIIGLVFSLSLIIVFKIKFQPTEEITFVNEIPDETGYLHPFPCHSFEIASYLLDGKSGCYTLELPEQEKQACELANQNFIKAVQDNYYKLSSEEKATWEVYTCQNDFFQNCSRNIENIGNYKEDKRISCKTLYYKMELENE